MRAEKTIDAGGATVHADRGRTTRFTRALIVASLVCVLAVPAFATTFNTNSLVIPMDSTYQNYGMWKAYGLVYKLLQNGIVINWAIDPAKSYNGSDFTATTQTYPPSGGPLAIGSHAYTGGPFVIDSASVAAAQPIIAAWWAANGNQPAIHQATAGFTATVNIALARPPLIALEATNAGIATTYFNAAGIPDNAGGLWSTSSTNVLNETQIANGALFQSGTCSLKRYDVFVTPHNSGYAFSNTDPTNLGTRTYAALDNFVYQGGGWIALCHSILSNENNIANLLSNSTSTPSVRNLFLFYQKTNCTAVAGAWTAGNQLWTPGNCSGFLTEQGFAGIANGGGTWTVNIPSLPIAQVVPTVSAQGLPGGSVQTWLYNANGTGGADYLSGVERIATFKSNLVGTTCGSDVTCYDHAVNGVYHGGAGRGKMTFIGGHSFSTALPYSTNFEAPYLRMFYNALFFNGSAVAKVGLEATPATVPQSTPTLVTIAVKNTGASPAQNVLPVTITLSPGVTYVPGSASPPPSSQTATTITWNSLGTVNGGATAATFQVTVNYAATGTQQVAGMTSTYGDAFAENFSANDCLSINVIGIPVPTLTKTETNPPTPDTYYPGAVVKWTLAYGNNGSATLVNAVLEDVLPAGFTIQSASPTSPAYTSTPLAGGTTRVRWNIGTLAPGATGTMVINAVCPLVVSSQSFTNNASFSGVDISGTSYGPATASSSVTVIRPPIDLAKTVDLASAQAGDTLTYTITPNYTGTTPAAGLTIWDPIPANTAFSSVAQGGTRQNPYVSSAAVNGVDSGPPSTVTAVSVSPTTQAIGGAVTVTVTLTNNDNAAITNVQPDAAPDVNGGLASCSAPSQTGFTVPANGSAAYTYTCTVTTYGEYTFAASPSATWAAASYSFPTGTSNSLLVTTTGGSDVVVWNLGATAVGTPGINSGSAIGPAVYAMRGSNSTTFWKFETGANVWTTKAPLAAAVEEGGALAYDGNSYATGYIYSLRGNKTNSFYRYQPSTDTWTTMANTPGIVDDGGALVALGGNLYAFQGNGQAFWKYTVLTNTWSTLANTPIKVSGGGALTTDGTNIYGVTGNNRKFFWQYNVVTNSWTALAPRLSNVNRGGALVYLPSNGLIYGTIGNNTNRFASYNISTNSWTTRANLPANVGAGGALTTDGTFIYCLRGNGQLSYYRYDPVADKWITLANALATVGGNGGGSLAWFPGNGGAYAGINTMTVAPSFVLSGSAVTVTMTLTNGTNAAILNEAPGAITVTGTGTGSATCGAVTPASQTVPAGGSATYTWTCTATATSAGGSVTFSASATNGTFAYPAAISDSVLVTPPLTFKVKINNALSPASTTEIDNYAMIDDASAFANGVASNPAITKILAPQLAITKTNAPTASTNLAPGSALTYTIQVNNYGTASATNVQVVDALNTNLNFVGCTTPQGACSFGGGNVTFNGGITIAPDTTITLTISTTVKTTLSVTGSPYAISNSASVTAQGGVGPIVSNTVSNTVVVQPALSLTKAQSATPAANANGQVTPPATITYTLTVKNITSPGTTAAPGIVISDPVPSGTTYVAASCAFVAPATGTCSQAGGIVTWTFTNAGGLAAGSQWQVSFGVSVASPVADADGTIDNIASVTSTGLPATVFSNLVSYGLNAAPVLAVTKAVADTNGNAVTQVTPGQLLDYTVTVKNTGNVSTNSAFITDTLPANVTYVAGTTVLNGSVTVLEATPGVAPVTAGMKVYSPGNADPDGDGGILDVGNTIPPGATIKYRVQVNSPIDNGSLVANSVVAGSATTLQTAPVTTSKPVFSSPNLTVSKGVAPSGSIQATDSNGFPTVLTFTISVTNSGNMTAHNITITDALDTNLLIYPAEVWSNPANPSMTTGVTNPPATSFSGGTITWSGLEIPPGTTTLTFQANPRAQSTSGTYTINNRAKIQQWMKYTSSSDPGTAQTIANNPANTSNQTVNQLIVPTAVKLRSFSGERNQKNVALAWQTGLEVDNLGFNVWREQNGVRSKVNRNLIAGSAFASKKAASRPSYSYATKDKLDSASTFVQYWLEDIDLHGTHTMHGPLTPLVTSRPLPDTDPVPLPGLGVDGYELVSAAGSGVIQPSKMPAATPAQRSLQLDLAGDAGLKIYVTKEGWYRVTAQQMIAAGLDPSNSAKKLGLYCGGIEQPVIVNGKSPNVDSIEFYGLGLDTVSTGARTYWLRLKNGNARYAPVKPAAIGVFTGNAPFTSQLVDRFLYLAGVLGPEDWTNWTGPLVTSSGLVDSSFSPITPAIPARNVDAGPASIQLVVQGITDGAHNIDVSVNGDLRGQVALIGQQQKTFTLDLPAGALAGGAASIAMVSKNGDDDLSGLISTRLMYRHLLQADDDAFEAVLPGAQTVTVGGFISQDIRALDVTDPLAPVMLDAVVTADGSRWTAQFTTPVRSGGAAIFVASDQRTLSPPEMTLNRPSSWMSSKNSADMVIITNNAFSSAASTLASYRSGNGTPTLVVDVEDLYDELNFGIRDPQAIRSFLQSTSSWSRAPKSALLFGDATFDPRNYFGMGTFDLMPTRLVQLSAMRTASDAWFADFNDDGIEDLAIGRIPARDAATASLIVSKITSRSLTGAWTGRALMVADANSTWDFQGSAATATSHLPSGLTTQSIRFGSDADPHTKLIDALNAGALFVEYFGHGSNEIWSDGYPGTFNSGDALNLTNQNQLPLVITMTCLNGYFQDLFTESLAEAFLRAPGGGAVGVWASSTLTNPDAQELMNAQLLQQLATPGISVGEAMRRAKLATTDRDVRASWTYFGDPSMKLR